jgi:glc operon protein GlcG
MHKFSLAILTVCAALLLGAETHAQQPKATAPLTPPPAPPYGAPITLAQAKKAAEAAEAEAKKNNMIMAIAVVEPNGELVYFLRMDGTQYASIKIAQDKAISAAIFNRPGKSFRDRVSAGDLSPMALRGAVASAGGIPIVVDNKTIGAIGSSGGNDELVSQAGADALK